MTKFDRPISRLLMGCLPLGFVALWLTGSDGTLAQLSPHPVGAQVVVIDGASVRTSSGFSFTYTDPRWVPGYPIGGFPFRPDPRYNSGINSGINNSTLINPTIVNSPIRNSTLINPTIINSPGYGPGYPSSYSPGYVNPGYQSYPYSVYTIQTVDRPAPEIVVDPQYGVRFKHPPGY